MEKSEIIKYLKDKYKDAEKEYNRTDISLTTSMLYEGAMYAYNSVINFIEEKGKE